MFDANVGRELAIASSSLTKMNRRGTVALLNSKAASLGDKNQSLSEPDLGYPILRQTKKLAKRISASTLSQSLRKLHSCSKREFHDECDSSGLFDFDRWPKVEEFTHSHSSRPQHEEGRGFGGDSLFQRRRQHRQHQQ